MRTAVALLVMALIAAPVAVAGDGALAIAKRALRLAKEPPKVKQIYTTRAESEDADFRRIRVRCPRGMIAAAITPETPSLYESVQGRVAFAVLPQQRTGFGPGPDGITVTCIVGRLER